MTTSVDPRWTYDTLASSYDLRPDYSAPLVEKVLDSTGIEPMSRVLEVGAGTGKFTAHLCRHGWDVTAIEPSAPMRAHALAKPALAGVRWIAAIGESLPIRNDSMRLIAYASSFNCVESGSAMREARRVLTSDGQLLTLWNYRDLDDPLQREVESIIASHIPLYDPGSRRVAPMDHPLVHTLFDTMRIAEARFVVDVIAVDWIVAWSAHGTVVRQAGDRMPAIVDDIRSLVSDRTSLSIPYITRMWIAAVRR